MTTDEAAAVRACATRRTEAAADARLRSGSHSRSSSRRSCDPRIVVRAAGGSRFPGMGGVAAVSHSGARRFLRRCASAGWRAMSRDGTSGLHRDLRRGDREGRPGDARHARCRLRAVPVRARRAALAVQAHSDADGRGHGHHADPGHRDADYIRDAEGGSRWRPGRRRSGERAGDRGRHRGYRAQGNGRSAPLGTRDRRGRRIRRRRVLRSLRRRARG